MECYFCRTNVKYIDYKETELLNRFVSGMARIRSRKRTGVCAKHQRILSRAIKRARFLALLPYTSRP